MARTVTFMFTLLFATFAVIIFGGRYYKSLRFEQGCRGYLKLAADANNVRLASTRLDTAIKYLEDHELVKGNSGIIFSVPKNDIEIWYGNLKAAQKNLHEFSPNASETDQGVTLVKLRETLLDKGESGEHVTTPENISVYPNQVLWVVLIIFGVIMGFLSAILFLLVIDSKVWG